MIVLDANILIRAVLGRRVRQLIDTYGSRTPGNANLPIGVLSYPSD